MWRMACVGGMASCSARDNTKKIQEKMNKRDQKRERESLLEPSEGGTVVRLSVTVWGPGGVMISSGAVV